MNDNRTLEKVYEPAAIEEKWSRLWLEQGLFTASTDQDRPRFSMVIPPPNITGSLHMGHALNNTVQDVLARYKRMKGFNVLWLPGIDHAGIATQNVVEKQLLAQGKDRHSLGRDLFIERVWEWKEESGGTIINQLKRLGASCDWTRQRFTMDQGLSRAVREVFARLYKEGLIYRGDYIINWCPRCMTALSDLEAEREETDGHLYHIEYPLKEGGRAVVVATTRPETMLGDMAVAINPADERYKGLAGKTLVLPLAGREIPVIEDDAVDMEFGTGAVKITPAHDFNDFETANRHGLDPLVVMGLDGSMNDNAGRFRGMDRFDARKAVIEELEALGALRKTEPHRLMLGRCYRCRTVVEPTLSKQWFVKTAPLAGPAVEAVQSGRTRFVPQSWENTYFDWMANIRDWCISRQIWWGHRIPAWHCRDCAHITVSSSEPRSCEACGSKSIEQDPDVLDTWFSSALWPFSTLGWPDDTREMKLFYPTATLSTGFDIIFFWVARMMMMGLKFMGDVPFRDVYIHALVRDSEGHKMSKSKGNVIDPLVMMDRYGTDALRFTLAAMAAQGRDMKLSEDRVEGYRNFANKLWNLARFALMNAGPSGEPLDAGNLDMADRWILRRSDVCMGEVEAALDAYNFDVAAKAVYRFLWHELCDWYVELIKPDLKGSRGEERAAASRAVLDTVLKDALALLHPFMPFITEEIWSYFSATETGITSAGFPGQRGFGEADSMPMETVMEVIRAIRNIRMEANIPPQSRVNATLVCPGAGLMDILKEGACHIKLLAGVEGLLVEARMERPRDAVSAIASTPEGNVEVFVPLKGVLDLNIEEKRLLRELEKIGVEMGAVESRLSNQGFISRAPADVVAKERERLSALVEKKGKLMAGADRIKAMRGE